MTLKTLYPIMSLTSLREISIEFSRDPDNRPHVFYTKRTHKRTAYYSRACPLRVVHVGSQLRSTANTNLMFLRLLSAEIVVGATGQEKDIEGRLCRECHGGRVKTDASKSCNSACARRKGRGSDDKATTGKTQRDVNMKRIRV